MSRPAGMNRAAARGWDARVRDARAKYAEVPMPDGDPVRVYIPDTDTLTEFFAARQRGNVSEALGVLMGRDNVARLEDAAKVLAGEDGRIPVTVWRELLEDVMDDLGMTSPER